MNLHVPPAHNEVCTQFILYIYHICPHFDCTCLGTVGHVGLFSITIFEVIFIDTT